MNEQHIEEQPYDDRHNAAPRPARFEDGAEEIRPLDGEHIGNDHQEPTQFRMFSDPVPAEPTSFFRPDAQWRGPSQMPSRIPGESLVHPHVREHGIPSFGTGLNWVSPDGTVRHDLANFPWTSNRQIGVETSNIELRTMYAHLIEAATLARAEMRERGLQVDI